MAHFIWQLINIFLWANKIEKNVNIFCKKPASFKIIILLLHRFLEDVLINSIEN